MSQLQVLEEDAFLLAWVALNQYGLRRDEWRAFMNGPAWAFKSQIRWDFILLSQCSVGLIDRSNDG